MNIQQLAAQMNVSESDLKSFLACLRLWMDKGYSLEEAITKNYEQMLRLVYGFHNMSTEDKKALVFDTFFPD